MIRSPEADLRRLRTDYVDVFWAHLPDTVGTPHEAVADTLPGIFGGDLGKLRQHPVPVI